MGKTIKLLIMDIDGTLTDGKINIGSNGEIFKSFNAKDGLGIHDILPKCGIEAVIITGRKSRIAEIRCEELGIKYLFQSSGNKVETLDKLLSQLQLVYDNCAFIGDDLNDYDCMKRCAERGCPSDAAKEIKQIATFVSEKTGGNGAVREFIEYLRDRKQ